MVECCLESAAATVIAFGSKRSFVKEQCRVAVWIDWVMCFREATVGSGSRARRQRTASGVNCTAIVMKAADVGMILGQLHMSMHYR